MAAAGRAAGAEVSATSQFRGGADLLCFWGPGAPSRFEPMRAQLAAGGHIACFDLAYWQRLSKVRVSIDAAHPQRWVMQRNLPFDRLIRDDVTVEEGHDPQGPIILAGLGDKARVQYGPGVIDRWEQQMADGCRARWGRPVLYRRKRPTSAVPAWATLASDGPIESVLTGASLLVTWHSNVAVDAIRLGIPVVCHDGAAAAVCPSTLDDPRATTPLEWGLRWAFLANLAWFQWTPQEAPGCWKFLSEALA